MERSDNFFFPFELKKFSSFIETLFLPSFLSFFFIPSWNKIKKGKYWKIKEIRLSLVVHRLRLKRSTITFARLPSSLIEGRRWTPDCADIRSGRASLNWRRFWKPVDFSTGRKDAAKRQLTSLLAFLDSCWRSFRYSGSLRGRWIYNQWRKCIKLGSSRS